jgi:TetR/AcrR family transcriptional regulator
MVNTARARRSDEAADSARARVLRAALELFSSKGFDGCGLRELAIAASVNHSLVLYHFGSMDGVWKAVVSELVEDYRRRVSQRLAGLSALDPVTRLKVSIEDFIRFSMEKPEPHRIMTLEGRRRTPRLTGLVETYLKPMYEETAAIIARGQAEGTIRRFDPALLYYGFISLGATPSAFAPEIEAVTGRRICNEATVVELMAMVSTLLFVGETDTPSKPKPEKPKTKEVIGCWSKTTSWEKSSRAVIARRNPVTRW